MNGYLSLLKRNQNFRHLWTASLITMLGDWFNTIGTVILISRYTDSGVAIASLFLVRMLPPFVFSPLAGLVADRFNRKAIMIVSDLLRVGIVLGFLLVDSAEEAWLVYLLTAAQFIVSTFYNPAYSAILPNVLDDQTDLLLANTLGSITWSAMLAIGAAIGGATAAIFGVYTALTIDAATFLLSAILLSRISLAANTATERSDEKNDTSNGWEELVAGVRYLVEEPKMGMVALVKAFGHIGSINIVMTVYASTLFVYGDGGAAALGMMMAASGLGAVLGPLIANHFTPEKGVALRRSIGIGFAIIAVGWILIGQSTIFIVVLGAMMLRSMGGSINWTYSSVLLQMNVPNRMLGRVFALDEAIRTLVASIGIWFSGYAMDSMGISASELAIGFGLAALIPMFLWVLGSGFGRVETGVETGASY